MMTVLLHKSPHITATHRTTPKGRRERERGEKKHEIQFSHFDNVLWLCNMLSQGEFVCKRCFIKGS